MVSVSCEERGGWPLSGGGDVRVVLVVPLGLDGAIFPWGVHLIHDHLAENLPNVDQEIWDLRANRFFADLNRRYARLLGRLFLALRGQAATFLGPTVNPYVFLGLVAFLGPEFTELMHAGRSLARQCRTDLTALQREFLANLESAIEVLKRDPARGRRLWALSVYDRTLFNALETAKLIRRRDPEGVVVLGGDYFDFPSAEKTLAAAEFVDGIVVGYGEHVMQRIVERLADGGALDALEVAGLVVRSTPGDSPTATRRDVSVPQFYLYPQDSQVRWAEIKGPGVIRVLSQRGCSWGRCAFCTQLDRKRPFRLPENCLIQQVDTLLQQLDAYGREPTVKIIFDSDETDPDVLAGFLHYLEREAPSGLTYAVESWLQVKRFTQTLAETLAAIDRRRISVLLVMNFESLNGETLRHMRKGHTPLQAIAAAKAILDCGHEFSTNYFVHFPLQDRESVTSEVACLRAAMHLFTPPGGRVHLLRYGANDRDDISRCPERYGIRVRRLRGDNWLRGAFGVDLPFSIWAHTWCERLTWHTDRLLMASYGAVVRCQEFGPRILQVARANWGEPHLSRAQRCRFRLDRWKQGAWDSLHTALRHAFGGQVLATRSRLFGNVASSMEAARSPGAGSDDQTPRSVFRLDGQCLTRVLATNGAADGWCIELSEPEVRLLRFLYWPRTRNEAVAAFTGEVTDESPGDLLDRHVRLGSLLSWKGKLLSVVSDPGYWRTRPDVVRQAVNQGGPEGPDDAEEPEGGAGNDAVRLC